MELNWTTFTLELVNFLVLIWILKRFLYHPVLKVIGERRRRVEQTLEDARRVHRDAEALRHDYETRMSQWEAKQEQAHEQLRQALHEEKLRRLAQLDQELASEREKAAAIKQRSLNEEQRHLQRLALQQSATFASRLLARTADPALQDRLLQMLIEDLQQLDAEQRSGLQAALAAVDSPIEVVSALPLDDAQRQRLHEAVTGLSAQVQPQLQFHEDPALLAGVRVTVGPWVLRANLLDELQFFTEAYHDGC